jgi:hypothetical protein
MIPFTKYDLSKLKDIKLFNYNEEALAKISKKLELEVLTNLEGSSLSFGNKMLTCQLRTYNEKGDFEKSLIFWNLEEQKMMRDHLDTRVEAVFYARESDDDHSWANTAPTEMFVLV